MHAKTAYYMHAKHARVIYTPSPFFRINTTSFHFYFGVLFIRIFMRPGWCCTMLLYHLLVLFTPKDFYTLHDFSNPIGLCQVTSHSRESKCILGIAAICKVSKQGCSVAGELSFSFALKWYVLVVLKSAIVNYMIEKVKNSPRRKIL